jgi:hypothetical protein
MATITSAQTGDWTASSTWVGGVSPGNGDSAVIASSHIVTVDSNITVGTSDVDDVGVAAITVQNGATLVIDAFTLTCRGDIDISACNNSTRGLDLLAGASIEFDDTVAVGSESYRIITPSQYPGTQPCIRVRGTSILRCSIGIATSGTYGRIVGSGANYFGLLDAEFCDFSDLGTDALVANELSTPSDGDNNGSIFRLINCTFTSCGKVNCQADGSHTQLTVQNSSFKSPLGTRSINYGSYTPKLGSGIRLIDGCVFEKRADLFSPRDLTLSGNFFQEGYSTSNTDSEGWTISSGNFVRCDDSNEEFIPRGDVIDEFWYYDSGAKANPHFMFIGGDNATTTQTVSGVIFEARTPDAQGDCMLVSEKPSATTINISQCIGLPNSANDCSGTLVSALGNANTTLTIENCTHFCGSQPGVAVGETFAGFTSMFSSIRGNIFHDSAGGRSYKVADSGTNDTVSDLVSSANLDYNCGYNMLAGSNLKGYNNLEFSSGTPGSNDVDTNPNFVDSSRDLASWDASLGGAGTGASAITELRKLNDSDYNSNYSIDNLLDYIRAGLKPSSSSLQASSFDGSSIGAVQFSALSKKSSMILGLSKTIFS